MKEPFRIVFVTTLKRRPCRRCRASRPASFPLIGNWDRGDIYWGSGGKKGGRKGPKGVRRASVGSVENCILNERETMAQRKETSRYDISASR